MANPYSQFVITDGTTLDSGHRNEVSLLRLDNGLCISDWSMRVAEAKSGGVWADSSLSDGRFLKVSKLSNVQETLTLTISDFTADALADDLHRLYSLLEKARNWGPSGWSREPVWIEAVGVNETNVRYSLIHDYRTPGAGNPFQQPFWQQVLRSSIGEFELVLEREPAWRGNYPGDADCVEISAMQEMPPTIYPLIFNATTSEVDLASPAALDDLAVGSDMTVEAWIYPEGWGENNVGRIADKSGNLTVGWTFGHNNVDGLFAEIYFDVTNAKSTSGLDEWGPAFWDSWHHVAFTFTNATKTIRLWIDGAEVTSYATQQAGANNAAADAAQTAQIGNIALGTATWDGEIGWLRIWSNDVYAAGFTPDPRCIMPTAEAFAVWIGICEGTGSTIYDLSGNGNNGTANNTTWGDSCPTVPTYGTYDAANAERIESCDEDFAFIANKHNTIGLTHVFVEDGGAFSANLLAGDPPYNLMPAAPVANDRAYFGIQSTLVDAGPFCSLVFDLSATITGTTLNWEYWNGAWVALTVQDNTSDFRLGGSHSVHWAQPSDWAATAVNGVTALWVRAEIQGASVTTATQQTSHVYTILWPYVEIQADQLYGNIPTLARMLITNQSDNDTGTRLYYNRVLMGLRSVSRGEYFTPYINLTSKPNQQFPVLSNGVDYTVRAITVSASGTGSLAADVTSPTGSALTVTNPAALAQVCSIRFYDDATAAAGAYNSISLQYQGTFHLFLRGQQTSGSAGDISTRIRIGAGSGTIYTSDLVEFAFTNDWQALDFGSVTIDTAIGAESIADIYVYIDVSGDGAADAKFYDLALMPTDELLVDVRDVDNVSASRAIQDYEVGIDNVSVPGRWSGMMLQYGNYIQSIWQAIGPGGPVLLPETRQRLWFLTFRYPSTTTVEQRAEPWAAGSVNAWATERYLLMRGDK